MTTISITNKQKQILKLLYTFRFLTIIQFQKLLSHKDPRRINEWLKDLKDKKYITRIKNEKDVTKPIIYCLAYGAKYFFRGNEEYSESVISKFYKEKNLTENFINHNLSLVDVYLFFQTQKEKDTDINFFTKHELVDYEYFPKELPDVYISVDEKVISTRYFLDLIDDYTPSWVVRKKVKAYLQYYEDNTWQANTKNSNFPNILFVLPNERMKKHINHFSKAVLEKTYNDDISIFLTTKDKIKQSSPDESIWQTVLE